LGDLDAVRERNAIWTGEGRAKDGFYKTTGVVVSQVVSWVAGINCLTNFIPSRIH
jgi:hypothetical protein